MATLQRGTSTAPPLPAHSIHPSYIQLTQHSRGDQTTIATNLKMVSPTYARRHARSRRSSTRSTIFSTLTLCALIFVAIICFLPVGSQVKAQDDKPDYGTVIGIDLGTTYSCVA